MLIDIVKGYLPMVTTGVPNVRQLLAAGARFGCGNDAGALTATPAMVREELTLFDFFINQETGSQQFSGLQALRTATIHSAEAMGLADRFGSITPRKVADFVVLDGDPLQDASLIGSRAEALFVNGRLIINNCGLVPEQTEAGKSY